MWSSIFSVGLLLLEWFLKANAGNQAIMDAFYKFIHRAIDNGLNSVEAGKAWRDQADALIKQLEKK